MAALNAPNSVADVHTGRAAPADFGEVVLALRGRLSAGSGLADLVREDIVACGEQFQLAPTVGRYAGLVTPREHPEAAREVAHQVVLAAAAERTLVVSELARRHPDWIGLLRQSAIALDLLGGHASDRSLPSGVGPLLADGVHRFAVGEVIAVGAQGVIATAIDRDAPSAGGTGGGRSVVVKLLGVSKPDGADPAAAATRDPPWRIEAERASRMQHPCGVRVLWAGEVERGQASWSGCVVFERIVGRSLVALHVLEAPADLESLAVEFVDLSLALAELHDRGLAHGDISPANVLIDAYGRLRLVDYGLSQPITPALAAHDVQRLAELVQWTALGFVPRADAPLPRGLGLRSRLLRAAASARARPTEAAEFAGALADCLQGVHLARGLVEVVAGASVLFAIGAILGEAFP